MVSLSKESILFMKNLTVNGVYTSGTCTFFVVQRDSGEKVFFSPNFQTFILEEEYDAMESPNEALYGLTDGHQFYTIPQKAVHSKPDIEQISTIDSQFTEKKKNLAFIITNEGLYVITDVNLPDDFSINFPTTGHNTIVCPPEFYISKFFAWSDNIQCVLDKDEDVVDVTNLPVENDVPDFCTGNCANNPSCGFCGACLGCYGRTTVDGWIHCNICHIEWSPNCEVDGCSYSKKNPSMFRRERLFLEQKEKREEEHVVEEIPGHADYYIEPRTKYVIRMENDDPVLLGIAEDVSDPFGTLRKLTAEESETARAVGYVL